MEMASQMMVIETRLSLETIGLKVRGAVIA
jgi:hypothetical protein